MNARNRLFKISLLSALMGLTACGGGGDDSSSTDTTAPAPTPVPTSTQKPVPGPGNVTTIGGRTDLSTDPLKRMSQIKADVRASTVYIESTGTRILPSDLTSVSEVKNSRGSGFIMTTDGHVVTNAHVAVGQGLYMITVEGRPRSISAQLISIAECEDLAVLKLVSDAPYPALSWSTNPPKISTRVGSAGFPADVETTGTYAPYTFTEGTINTDVLYESNYWSSADIFYHSATIAGGNSGGPLVELDTGTVVGVNYAGSQTRNMALSSTTSRTIVDKLLAGQDVLSIGFSGEMFYRFVTASGNTFGYGLSGQRPQEAAKMEPVGVWVRGVAAGGKAKKAGVLPGDIITTVAGVPLNRTDGTMNTYCNAMRSNNPNTGSTIEVEVIRPKAGGVTCAGEINGRAMGIKGAPSTACPETAVSSNGAYTGQVGQTNSPLNHELVLQVKDGVISGTGNWSDLTASISGTLAPSGAVSMTESFTYQGQAYRISYTGQYNPATRVIGGRVTFGNMSDDWSVGGR